MEGMLALIECFIANADNLREIYIHDNWIKNEAVDKLVDFLLRAKTLQKLNISDSDMGSEAVFRIVKALKESQASDTLEEFYCNFNEVDSSCIAKECLDIMLTHLNALTYVEFKGNEFSKKIKQEYIPLFEAKGKRIVFKEAAEEGEEEDEEEEDDGSDQEDDGKDKIKDIEDEIMEKFNALNINE